MQNRDHNYLKLAGILFVLVTHFATYDTSFDKISENVPHDGEW